MSTATAPAETSAIDTQHPWLGLASFTEETRPYFYGREQEVGELSRRVQRKLLTVLFGQSGLGKTSILNAGIVPRLRPEGYCPVYVRIDYGTAAVPPSEQIKQAIFRATEAQGTWTQTGVALDGESLWEFLHHRDDALLDAAGKPIIPLLIFDQFEEIFTLAQLDDAGRKRAAEFIEDLADLVENRPPKALEAKIDADDSIAERFDFSRADYRILISLREDYLAHLEGVKSAMPSITQNRMRLARMNGEQALAAVIKPGGKLVTQEVAESIVRFVAGGAELRNAEVEPSLLSLICRELNNARIAQGKSEISVDLLAGSNETILAEFYERALADQPAAVRKVIEELLLTDSGYRENLAEERVLKAFTAAGAKPDAASTLAALVNRRLLRIEERLDIRRVELTHDVLCGVVKLSREERKKREELAEAEQHLATQRARAAATKKALIRARQIAAGCAVLSVIAVGSGGYGVYSAIRAAKAEKEAVATRAISETSRGEAEKLVVFILDDFYEEMAPIGRLDVVGSLAKKAVEYYAQLPAEARTAETQRNSAVAQSRYAQVLTTLGKGTDAQTQLDTATATIKALRDSGDTTDATLIAEARVNGALVGVFSNRADQPGAAKAGLDALAKLKPVLDKPDAPRAARVVEAQIAGTVAFSQKNMGDTAAALALGQRALDLAKSLGALDLSDLPATANYIRTGWSQAETLTRVGKDAEARTLLEECIALADKLLALRPGHRQALASKATAFSALAVIDDGKLNVAGGLRSEREAMKVQIEATALDPGSSRSQNNLRRSYGRICLALWNLGQIDAALPLCEKALEIGKDERIDGFSALNVAFGHALYSGFQTALGDPPRAAREMAAAERYFGVMKTSGASARSLANVNALLASKRGEIALMTGGAAEWQKARSDVEQAIAARIATFGGAAPTAGAAQVLSGDHASAAELALALKDFAGAEALAKKALAYVASAQSLSLQQQLTVNDIRAILATALARQGKFDEAKQALQPALAYFKLPLVMQTDDETMKYWNARVLLAAAIANGDKPAEKAKFLADAAKRFDAMPATLKRLKSYAMLREQIAAGGQR